MKRKILKNLTAEMTAQKSEISKLNNEVLFKNF